MASTLRGRKRLGQQFLTDEQIYNQIGSALQEDDQDDCEGVNGDGNGWDGFDIKETDGEEDAEKILFDENKTEDSENDKLQNGENEAEDEGAQR